ncbi:hypothetical protein CRYUN_Cryun34aG0051100 [Craigia yunnanensis]
MHNLSCYVLLLLPFLYFPLALSWSQNTQFNQAENYEGSSDLVNLEYYMGPILASPINLYIIWYGHWNPIHQATIKDFLYSLSSSAPYPSVADWWKTVRLYTDQTGSNITVTSYPRPLPLNPRNGLYLVLTSSDVQAEDFSRAVCGFHYFTFPTIVGKSPPRTNGGNNIMHAPNGDAGVDGMTSVIAHELAEVSSIPLVNAWYAGDDPTAPTEIADLCLGLYGSGGGGGHVVRVTRIPGGTGTM